MNSWQKVCGAVVFLSVLLATGTEGYPESTTPLHDAVQSGSQADLKRLLRKGADIDAQNANGETPLHVAVLSNRRSIIKFLLKRGADIDAQDNLGKTPLHAAVWKDKARIVLLLLKRGADIDAQDDAGETPLHLAIRYKRETTIKRLLEYEATITEQEYGAGETPFHYAAWYNNQGALRRLLEYGVKHKKDVNARDHHGETVLHAAARWGKVDAVKLLLEKKYGVHVNALNDNKNSPLFLAGVHNRSAVVTLLKQAGAKCIWSGFTCTVR